MSWRGRKGNNSQSSYKQNASRLRDVLESRNQAEDAEGSEPQLLPKHPAGLRGRDIGMWYAKQNAIRKKLNIGEPKDRMVSPQQRR